MQTFTHFRSVFDVSPAADIERPWPALVGEVRAWIARKEREELKGWFFGGGSWSGRSPSRSRVQTRALSNGGESPHMWAVRYEHGDAAVRSRRWTTDIAVTEVADRQWRLAVTVSHWLRPDYVGREPQAPEPSSPRLVKALTDGSRWVCRVGSVRLLAKPVTLDVGKANQFVRMLFDSERLVPLVLVSCSRDTGTPLIDTVALSQALAGTAAVYVCGSPECDDELEHFLPFRFRSPNGTVRIYAPGVDASQEWSASRHRFFPARDIEALGDEEIARQIVRALTRSDAWRGLQPRVGSIDDIESTVLEQRLAELKGQVRSAADTEELLEIQSKINDSLIGDKKRLEGLLEDERNTNQKLQDQLASMKYGFEELRARTDEATAASQVHRAAVEAVHSLQEWPTSTGELIALLSRLYADRLVFTDRAVDSLRVSAFASYDDACKVLWRVIRAVAMDLHELVMQDPPPQNADVQFHDRTGFELAWTEGKQTKRDGGLMALRRLRYGEQEVDITPHVKWGNRSPKLLRVHFFVDRQIGRIVIGHCGDHLDTVGTRRRG